MGLVIPSNDSVLAALIDVAGHGLAAYAVAQKARKVIFENSDCEPVPLLKILDNALKDTVGAAASIARIRRDRLTFAGVGNVATSVGMRPLLVRSGILGLRMREPRAIDVTFRPESWLLMHTDGVSSPEMIPAGTASTAAAALVASHGMFHDDASVLLLRWRETR